MPFRCFVCFVLGVAFLQGQPFSVAGDWAVRVTVPGKGEQTVAVTPPVLVTVAGERHDRLPVFRPAAGGWVKGAALVGVKAQEATSRFLLEPESLVVRAGTAADARVFVRGKDYEADLEWGTVGRLEGGGIGADQPVYVSYRHAQMRLDAVVLLANGTVVVRRGEPRAAAPAVPAIGDGERRLGNVYLPKLIGRLSEDNLFPVLEATYPETRVAASGTVERVTKRLREGQALRILAWGDSVTAGSYLPGGTVERWQEQFVARLRARFPKARIELVTEAWGGRNTGSYLAVPAGSPHNYKETVLAVKPDLIISEFVNDAPLKEAQVEERYTRLLADFRAIGAEWIILTPHYVRPDWMNLTREREIDEDPRPYVAGLRQFATTHDVGLADASLRYGRLWRQGIPYNALMLNGINHPDARGMKLFADALMALFP